MFVDRVEAGRRLGEQLTFLRGSDVVVLGLPRGGVPVAREVATALHAALDVIVVRKLGRPDRPELAMGAIGEDGVRVVDQEVRDQGGVSAAAFEAVERREQLRLQERVEQVRRHRQRIDLDGRIAVIVDDGLATGSTARAACAVARQLGARRVVLAVPVAPAQALDDFREADEVVCVPRRHTSCRPAPLPRLHSGHGWAMLEILDVS